MKIRPLLVLMINTFLVISISGCTVGPNYHRPSISSPNTYGEEALPQKTAETPIPEGEAQRFILGKDIPAEWWSLFRSDSLDKVMRQALAASPNIAAAEAALRQAQENLKAQFGQVAFPQLDANFSAKRQLVSGASSGKTSAESSLFNLFNASVNVSYFLDFFGKGRRELEALRSHVAYEAFQLEAAYLSLTSNIVTAVGKEAALRAEIKATEDIISEQEDQLNIVEQQFKVGAVPLSDVLAQKEQLAQTRTTLPPLQKELSQTRHLLSVLTGGFPNQAKDLPIFQIQDLHLPQELPVSLPSDLVRQRPDIRAAESLLHAASAQVGVATADLFPQITISGSYGSDAVKTSGLFKGGTSIWDLGGQLAQPIFYRGQLTAQRRAAINAYEEAGAVYRETILLAFQNVADVLKALEEDANSLKAQAVAESSARDNLDLTKKQFKDGAVSYLSLLNAQRQYQQTRINLIQAQAARLADTAALFQALGGGWWNRGKNVDKSERSN